MKPIILKAGNELKSHHKILLNNHRLKEDFEKYKEKQENKPSITYDEKATEFVDIVEADGKIPTSTDTRVFSDNTKLCSYWNHMKPSILKAGNELKSHHKILLGNPILKEDFEKYKENKEKPSITYDEKATEFDQTVEADGIIPSQKDTRVFSDNTKVGGYWNQMKISIIKAGNELKSHHKILLGNPILKEDFEKYKENKEKPSITYDEKATEFDQTVEADGKIPSQRDTRVFSDNTKVCCYWNHMKPSILKAGNELKTHHKILLNNHRLKEDFERFKQLDKKRKRTDEES